MMPGTHHHVPAQRSLVEWSTVMGAFVACSVILSADPRQEHRLFFQFKPLHLAFLQQRISLTE
jgi:hypothetical protein